MNDDAIISVQHLSKSFHLPHERSTSIKNLIVNFYRRRKSYEIQKTLDDVNFDIKRGEFFGIVGRNGSGKSTLLKLLAGIYTPTKGEVHVRGSLTPFIELGVGFNPELTGRENVYLNGALLGFSRKEVNAMYQDIVDFAELEKFMDQKLKNYSSGMQVRLAFSIAIRAESDILILDEILAVGDEAFQQKCISVFEQYKARKQTIVLVTHDMGVVERFCTRALLLREGKIVTVGKPGTVARQYREFNKEDYSDQKQREETAKKRDENIRIQILDPETRRPKKRFTQGDTALVRLAWSQDNVLNAGVAIMKQSGEYIFGPNTIEDIFELAGKKAVDYTVKLNLGAGEYYLKAGLFGETGTHVIAFVEDGPSFMVDKASGPGWGGVAYLSHEWRV